MNIAFKVNGRDYSFVLGSDIAPEDSLAKVLREKLGFTGVKVACEQGACGACTVLLDGRSVLSCMMMAAEAHGSEIMTIEGLPSDDPVIKAFVEMNEPDYGTAMQCGFCTPGFVLETHALFGRSPKPTRDEISDGLSGHICRCGCYKGIMRAVELAAEELAAGESAAKESATREPAAVESAAVESAMEKPTPEKSAAVESAMEKPTPEKSAAEKSAGEDIEGRSAGCTSEGPEARENT